MKKLLCVLMAFALMFSVFALPASAEESVAQPAGKIYKLPGGYVDFIGMGGGRIVCGKSMGTDADGYPIIKYGAIDETGKTVVPFEYDYAYAPDDAGLFLAANWLLKEEQLSVEAYVIDAENTKTELSKYLSKFGDKAKYVDFQMMQDNMIALYNDIQPYYDKCYISVFNLSEKTLVTTFETHYGSGLLNICYDDGHIGYSNGMTLGTGNLQSVTVYNSYYDYQFLYLIDVDANYLYAAEIQFSLVDDTLVHRYTTFFRFKKYYQSDRNQFGYIFADGSLLEGVYDFEDVANQSYINDPVQDGKLIVTKGERFGFLNLDQEVFTSCIFDDVMPVYNEDYYAALENGKVTYVRTDGTFTDKYFACGSNFDNGKAFVIDGQGKMSVIDSKFNELAVLPESIGEAGLLYLEDDVIVKEGSTYTFYVYTEDAEFTLYGDVSLDEKVDVADIMLLKNYIMNDDKSEAVLAVADLDASGAADVADIMLLKNIIMTS